MESMHLTGYENSEFYNRAVHLHHAILIAQPKREDMGEMCIDWCINIGTDFIAFVNKDNTINVMCILSDDDKDFVYISPGLITEELYDELSTVLRRFEIAVKCKFYSLEGFTASDLKIKEDK